MLTIDLDALKRLSVVELQELGDHVHSTIVKNKLRGAELLQALDYLDAIESEIRTRPLPSSLEEACGLEADVDLPATWSPTALSDAERAIADYCAAHGMTYQQFRQKVDRWLAQQDAEPAGEVENVASRLRKLVRNKELRT